MSGLETNFVSATDVAQPVSLQRNGIGNNGGLSAAEVLPKAKEFESILLGQWLQGAETSFGSVPGGDDDQDAGDEQMKGFGVQQLAKALSDAGGVGIAKIVAGALAQEASSVHPAESNAGVKITQAE